MWLSSETLERWVEEFVAGGSPIADDIVVIPQDTSFGRHGGLVGVRLRHASTTTWIEPEEGHADRWVITFAAREEPVVGDSEHVAQLAVELACAAALCAFLQAKACEYAGDESPDAIPA